MLQKASRFSIPLLADALQAHQPSFLLLQGLRLKMQLTYAAGCTVSLQNSYVEVLTPQ